MYYVQHCSCWTVSTLAQQLRDARRSSRGCIPTAWHLVYSAVDLARSSEVSSLRSRVLMDSPFQTLGHCRQVGWQRGRAARCGSNVGGSTSHTPRCRGRSHFGHSVPKRFESKEGSEEEEDMRVRGAKTPDEERRDSRDEGKGQREGRSEATLFWLEQVETGLISFLATRAVMRFTSAKRAQGTPFVGASGTRAEQVTPSEKGKFRVMGSDEIGLSMPLPPKKRYEGRGSPRTKPRRMKIIQTKGRRRRRTARRV